MGKTQSINSYQRTLPFVEIMDSTLRDGEQTNGVSFLPHEKLVIARKLLSDVKVDRIEVASARVSEGERDAVSKICAYAQKQGLLDHVEVLGFVDGGKSIDWIASCGGRVVNLLAKGSLKHCLHQLHKSPEEHFSDIKKDSQGRIISYNDTECRHLCEYDERGNMVRRIDIEQSSGQELRHCDFGYDEHNRIRSAKSNYSPYNNIAQEEFVYDAQGNAILIRYYSIDGSWIFDINREYYEDNHLIRETITQDYKDTTRIRREYRLFHVEERYLTDVERRDLGLPYNPDRIPASETLLDPYTWQISSHHLILQ
jgi:YD repeat-containing protein